MKHAKINSVIVCVNMAIVFSNTENWIKMTIKMRRKKQIEDKIRELETLFPDNRIRSEMVIGILESLKWVLVNKK